MSWRAGIAVALIGGALLAGLTGDLFGRVRDEGRPVKYTRIGLNEYQNFLIGWDAAAQPQRFALIGSAAEYDQLFQPAATNGSRGPFAPPEKSYAQEQILLVARQLPAPENPEAVFEVESLAEQGEQLILKYRYREPAAASYEVRTYLALRIPVKQYARVVLIENGQQAGELDLSAGKWVAPPLERE